MCLIIAFVSMVYAIVALNAGNYTAGGVAIVIGLFFTGLLIKNIADVKKMRQEKKTPEPKEE